MNLCKVHFKQRGYYMKRQFIESFKRLYEKSILPKEKILALFKEGKITENEKNYILGA